MHRRLQLPAVWALLSAVLAVSLLSSEESQPSVPTGLEPDQSLAALVAQPQLRIELAASEPQVIDPVAIRFDAQGRMWVVEMRDYPLPLPDQPPAGRIRVLEDADGDGRFEKATTFVDQLMFPTGVQPWKNGVIVTLAGKICFFADDDGDLQSDRQEVWFTGFAEQNEQLRANHPTLAADGLVYVAGGLRGGTIESQDKRWQQNQPLKLSGVDFAFDPQGGFFGPVTGNSQYGLTIDDYGNRIGCSNRNPAIEAVLPYSLVRAQSALTSKDALNNAALVGPQSEVRPIAQAWTTSNLHAGQFSAACGVLRGCGPGMPLDWADDLFVCEPTSYVVQRQTTANAGAVLRARRVKGPECVASRDEWFRPVDLARGPDGCLYIVDMMRAVIEHPDWMPEELKTRADMRWGTSRGRIWRLSDKQRPRPQPETAPPGERRPLEWLSHPDPWHREIASQWLAEQPAAPELIEQVQAALSDPQATPQGVARAAQWLHKNADYDAAIAQHLLASGDAPLRRLALRLWSSQLPPAVLSERAEDEDAGVRFEVAVALASRPERSSTEAFTAIARRDGGDPWVVKILATAAPQQVAAVLRELLQGSADDLPSSSWLALAQRAGQAAPQDFAAVLQILSPPDPRLLMVAKGWTRPLTTLPEAARESMGMARRRAAMEVLDDTQSLDTRRLALVILSRQPDDVTPLRALLDASQPADLRADALRLLLRTDRSWTLDWLDESLTSLPPAIRAAAIATLLSDPATVHWLLDRIESRAISLPLVGLSNIDRLKRSGNDEIRQRAVKVFQATSENRGKIIAKYADALSGRGNPTRGVALFRQHCAACHQIGTLGTNVGPDISDSRTKSLAALLTAVLDPNAGIDAAYLRYTVLTLDGTIYDGLLLSDSAGTVTLQLQGGERISLLHDDIETISTSGVSLMPEGFEQLISVDDMRDLLSYVKNWRYQDGTIPLAD
ncbi:PVC-type heme-binding CxxCH protein [Roseimaritima ulvae]|uniref:Cytochrome c n=1 Tax=Roseimaritima ulvae TaxID=980254 RepID=A0A5B9QWL0_9BACT|nr:PVC-type heme-binding CxxCH protein [Roseimaritima ulvae]QEG41496.1 Cytochrome c [Roseimaritima ulvae]